MKASEILTSVPGSRLKGEEREFSQLRADSRSVKPGDAFIALKGSITDGHRFIDAALTAGAQTVICNYGHPELDSGITVIEVPDTKEALLRILPRLFPHARKLKLVGITGTSGKTTTTYLIESIMKAAGMNPGVIGTINIRYNGITADASVTTPGPVELFEDLDTMGVSRVDACVMEVSSHSLDQERIMGLGFDCAVFTNLSHDHLDYHKDMETYFQAKRKLFDKKYLRGRPVVNADDEFGQRLISELPEAITFGRKQGAAISVPSLRNTPKGLIMSLTTPMGEFPLRSRLVGEINAYNIMAAIGASMALGIDRNTIIKGIEELEQVPGRMEPVRNQYGLNIIVDYAHKPDALKNVLTSARGMTKGRLITIFGCGGDRDKTKRPVMGSIAAKISDLVIVTSDNPRTEEPLAIIEDILQGTLDKTYVSVEPDREEAIRLGITSMKEDDCLVIAGKGHETYQIIGSDKRPFDDRKCVCKCLREIYET